MVVEQTSMIQFHTLSACRTLSFRKKDLNIQAEKQEKGIYPRTIIAQLLALNSNSSQVIALPLILWHKTAFPVFS